MTDPKNPLSGVPGRDQRQTPSAPIAITDSEAGRRFLLESWAQAVWETDPEGVVVVDSPSWRAYTGQTLEELQGYGWLDAIHPDDRAYAEQQWRDAVAARAPLNAEFRLRLPGGAWRWTNVRAAPDFGVDGTITRWAGMNIDIDVRKRAEEALRNSEVRYRSLFETMGQGFSELELIRDPDGRAVDQLYIQLNPAFERLFGIPAAEAQGRLASEIFPNLETDWTDGFDRAVRTGAPQRIEHRLAALGRWFEVLAYPAGGDRLTVLYEDITDRKRAEIELRDSEQRQVFLLRLSDRLRAEPDGREIARTAVTLLAEHLRVDRAYVARIDKARDVAEIGPEYRREDLAPVEGVLTLSDFPEAFDKVEAGTLVLDDAAADPLLSQSDKEGFAVLRMGALIVASARRGERNPVWAILVASEAPRCWTPGEAALIEEVVERTWAAVERARTDAALRESQERNSLAMTVGELGAWDWDIATGAVTWSREHFEMQGYEVGEVAPSYEAWLARVHPDDRDATQQALIEARDRREPYRNKMRGLMPDGSIRHLQAQGRFFYDRDGEAVRMIGVMRNVTDEQIAQERLRRSEERYRALFESMDDAYDVVEVLQDADGQWCDFLFLEVNPAFAGQTGMPYPVGKTATQLLGTPNPRWAALYGQVLDTGEPIRVEEPENVLGRVFDLNIFPLGHPRDRKVAVLFNNITVRKDAEAALRQREADLARVQRIGQVGGLDIDVANGLTSRRSPEYLRLHGLPADTIDETHEDWLARVFPQDRSRAEAALFDALRGDAKSYQSEYRIVRASDGQVRWIHARADIERDSNGAALRLGGAHVDVTDQKEAQEALRKSEERFRALVTAGSYSIYRMSPDWRQMYQLESGTLAETAAPIEDWLEKYIPREDLPEVNAAVAEAIWTRSLFELEHRVHNAEGGLSWVVSRAVPILADDGRILEWFGSGVDVTERRLAEQAVHEGEERLRQFGEASQDVLWIRERDSLQWRYLTPAFETIYGLSRDEAMAGDNYANWLSLIIPEDQALAEASIRRVAAGEPITFEYRIRRPSDGAIRWLRHTDFPILNDRGEVILIGGAGHDFTDIREAELRLKVLAEGIPQLVWRAVDVGDWTWASPQWVAYTGQDEIDSHGRGWLQPLHPDDQDAALEAWARALAAGGFEVEYRIKRAADGAYRWFKTRASPVRGGDGAIIEWLGTSTDIHDLRELQERQKVLVAELQHRTRNLMGVVRSTSEKTARSSADLSEFRTKFRDRIDALSRVQGLLSRLNEHDRVTFDELIQAEMVAIDGASDHVSVSGPAGIRLRSSMVQALAMALHELATNALKYGALAQPAGRLSITWRVAPIDGGSTPWLHVDWRESGVVMPTVGAPAAGTGQGRELIERALPYQLQALTTYELGTDGVHCTIAVPISKTMPLAEGNPPL